MLEREFCQVYYPPPSEGYPPCAQVKAAVFANLSRPLPTLETTPADPSKPGMVFVHGWPDSAAEVRPIVP